MDARSQSNITDVYSPFIWLKNQHINTITASLIPRSNLKTMPVEELLIPVDKDSVVLAHAHIIKDIHKCMIIVHGLEGSSYSPYVLGLTQEALALGFNVVRLNLRNCGNSLHLTPTLYNAGQSADLKKVIAWLAQNKKQTAQYLVGYSLGGNLVLKTLAELKTNCLSVKGGCAISPSIDLGACVDRLEQGFNRVYAYYFLHSLRNKILLKHKLFPKRFDPDILKRVNSIRSFDDLFTAPDAGYNDAAHYYREASSIKLLNQIKIETLIITAQDDPLVPFESFKNVNNSHIHLLAPEHGGHVSFLHNNFDISTSLFWADKKILSFCQENFSPEGEKLCLN